MRTGVTVEVSPADRERLSTLTAGAFLLVLLVILQPLLASCLSRR